MIELFFKFAESSPLFALIYLLIIAVVCITFIVAIVEILRSK